MLCDAGKYVPLHPDERALPYRPHQRRPEFLQPKILHGIESSYGLAGRSRR